MLLWCNSRGWNKSRWSKTMGYMNLGNKGILKHTHARTQWISCSAHLTLNLECFSAAMSKFSAAVLAALSYNNRMQYTNAVDPSNITSRCAQGHTFYKVERSHRLHILILGEKKPSNTECCSVAPKFYLPPFPAVVRCCQDTAKVSACDAHPAGDWKHSEMTKTESMAN